MSTRMSPEANTRRSLVDLTADLARINSVNPTLDPAGAGEADVGEFVRAWMTDQGWEVHVEWPAAGRPNVVGVIKGGDGPTLMINAHLDTVGGAPETFEVTVADHRIHGRGVLDTKGGLAAALVAAASLDPGELLGDIMIATVCDEEADSIGTTHLLKGWHPDAAVVIEPTDLGIVTGHRGFGILDVAYMGRAAHTGHREEGINAIDPMARLVIGLWGLDTRLRERDADPLFGPPSIQVTSVDGGTELFTVPDRCDVSLEIRTVPGHDDDDMASVIEAVEVEATGGVTCHHEWVICRPPFGVDSDTRIVRAMQAGLSALGRSSALRGAPFWTDAALFTEVSTPAVVFGPGGHGVHSIEEWVEIDDLVACHDTLRGVMADFARPVESSEERLP